MNRRNKISCFILAIFINGSILCSSPVQLRKAGSFTYYNQEAPPEISCSYNEVTHKTACYMTIKKNGGYKRLEIDPSMLKALRYIYQEQQQSEV